MGATVLVWELKMLMVMAKEIPVTTQTIPLKKALDFVMSMVQLVKAKPLLILPHPRLQKSLKMFITVGIFALSYKKAKFIFWNKKRKQFLLLWKQQNKQLKLNKILPSKKEWNSKNYELYLKLKQLK